ncbi:MAG: nucleotidyltransferase domain-containing protein [Aphanizomenon flos-aquae KM1D3_PB]|jgi:predicted nucleotidyltransferase|uniref:nucleotidyltransferase family protein n=1 Tax=Aphanizomenon flos-aquae TaxID=1176 RepID=UPI00054316C0|nr:nucleotidyltransferase domain-containing protein [Aphanizomenon flos-aquae]KHG39169.1 DNA polymerase III subunit beta [Aphanizomenon flos-aquae 2012/KM1/D3]QSV73876.1 MAG: nucleotidyltransferase domain-containing protein [Aphanizomenon flos-aquae KM1D3_PB]
MSLINEATKQRIIQEVLEARKNRPQFLVAMQERQKQGLKIARQCAKILKERFGAEKVVLFGSLLDHQQMSWRSDIDLAVWGLPEKDYFKAVGVLLDIAEDFSLDLMEAQHAKSYISPAISQGIEL